LVLIFTLVSLSTPRRMSEVKHVMCRVWMKYALKTVYRKLDSMSFFDTEVEVKVKVNLFLQQAMEAYRVVRC
jgi:hypothetical protein